jgi:Cytochrome c7 and related cytochrome c
MNKLTRAVSFWLLMFALFVAAVAPWLQGSAQAKDLPKDAAGNAKAVGSATLPLGKSPSFVIFPPQSLPLKFDHGAHLALPNVTCEGCHTRGKTSEKSSDNLLPSGRACDTCHASDHTDTLRVLDLAVSAAAVSTADSTRGKPSGACASCHEGGNVGSGSTTLQIAKVRIPEPNLKFSHKAHAVRSIGCPQCHGDMRNVGLATRAELPTMQRCIRCHALDAPGPTSEAQVDRGGASGTCETCHIAGGATSGGRIQTLFSSGQLLPQKWLRNAAHDASFMQRHKYVAGNDSKLCTNCHKEESCTECHDGRVRPRTIHPGDYLSMHAVESKLASSQCASCHREQNFCLSCHQRMGVSMSGPPGVREAGRFHPPKAIWASGSRSEHAREAMRNLATCVSCHTERDCVACHGGGGVGGGFSPHPPGFASGCRGMLSRNPRPCLVCHEPDSAAIGNCR